MNANYLPAIASHARFSEWIDTHEQLLASYLLLQTPGGELAGLFLSRDANGELLIRLCQGPDDRCMRWEDQRRCRSRFGPAYAEARVEAWLKRLEAQGWRREWSARQAAAAESANEPTPPMFSTPVSPQYARAF